jgi:hypothetical protein
MIGWAWLALGAVWLLLLPLDWCLFGRRRGTARWVHDVIVFGAASQSLTLVEYLASATVAWACAPVVLAALWFGRTPLGMLNFVVLQWFGVRLVPTVEGSSIAALRDAARRGRWWSSDYPDGRVTWGWCRWVWPLTGWWSRYRWIGWPRSSGGGDLRRPIAGRP